MVAIAGFAAAAAAGPVFEAQNVTGTTDWDAFDGTDVEMGHSGNSQSHTSTSTHGQTGGGILDVCSLLAEVDAEIADSFAPGDTLVTYQFHSEASFDTTNYSGSISCAVIAQLSLTIDSFMTFTRTDSGDLGGTFSFTPIVATGAAINGDVLSPGSYRIFHSFGARAGTRTGQSASETQDGMVQFVLTPQQVIPLPSAAAMGGIGLMVVGLRRRRM